MKIHVPKITEEGLDLTFSRDGKWFQGMLPKGEEERFRIEKVDVTCRIRKVREAVFVDGSLDTVVETDCSLCLERAHIPVSSRFHYTFMPCEGPVADEKELSADDMDVEFYPEETIDLDPVIIEQIILQIPMRIVCSESCKGLCPRCGANLNTSTCGCSGELFNDRMRALRNLKIK